MVEDPGGVSPNRPAPPETALLRQALDELGSVFYIIDPDGELYWWNEAFAAVTGYDHGTLAEMDLTDVIPPADHEAVTTAIKATLEAGHATVEIRLTTADGEQYPYELTGTRLETDNGEFVGLVGTGRDITEQKQRQADLEAAETQLTAALNTETISTWRWSFADDVVVGGTEFTNVLGIDPETAYEGVPIEEVFAAHHPEDETRVEAVLDEATDSCGDFKTTYRNPAR